MGVSTDGQICFGVKFEEDYEFPWATEEDLDIEAWWKRECGFVPLPGVWTEAGEKYDGVTGEQVKEYFAHQREWEKQNPIPVVEVNYCSGDYPMIILAAPSSVNTNNRGCPLEFVPQELIPDERETQVLQDFCNKYELEESDPKWWLSSYWG